jgi:glycosyltransferase involved in cell wall biosynthesis
VRISVFTPSHDTRHLDLAYESLASQSFADWEWIVLLNGKAANWRPPAEDARVKVSRAPSRLTGVGAVKRAACDLAAGDILVELDHDDALTRGSLAAIAQAFSSREVVVAYSDWAQINNDGSPNFDAFDLDFGWVYTRGAIDGRDLNRCHAMEASPHNVGYIWYAPNHVRAFRRTTYDEVGGFDAARPYLDDHDLLCRLYLKGDFHHITRCCYLQRVHSHNTQREKKVNAAIQEETVGLYRQYIEAMGLAWAARRGLQTIRVRTPVWIGDEPDERYEDVIVDPDDPSLGFDADSVGIVKANDVLPRIAAHAQFFNEVYRVLPHAGLLLSKSHSTDGRGAFQDLGYRSFYNENTFMYLTQEELRPAMPALTARFQVSHLRTFFPSAGHEQLDIAYVEANLLAVKGGPRQGGPLLV